MLLPLSLLLSSLLSHFALSQAYIVFYSHETERDIGFAFNLDYYLYQCPGWFFGVGFPKIAFFFMFSLLKTNKNEKNNFSNYLYGIKSILKVLVWHKIMNTASRLWTFCVSNK